jgi:muramoyltetrapeptide carboxypeptidase LdcA involved in peptidoglycan recycling
MSGVIATIGGLEQLRILKHLDEDVLREHPIRFYGMSDNTNLNLALFNAGLVSFNGAQLMNEIAVPGELPEYTERYCRRVFFEDPYSGLEPSREWTDEPSTWWTNPEELGSPPEYEDNPGWEWRGGSQAASGRLWGGSQSIVKWQLATDRYVPDPETLAGNVLALEVAETLPEPQTVASTLMCLGERGLLESFEGVLLGRVPGRSFMEEPPAEDRKQYRQAVRNAVVEQVTRYNPAAPVVCGLDWGHTNPVAPLPIGAEVHIDPESATIEMTL